MSWTIQRSPSDAFIEVIYSGRTTNTDLTEATSQCISLGKETGTTRFLVDASGIELAASMNDLYDLPTKQYVHDKAQRTGAVALILPASEHEKPAARFYEFACRNAGWLVRSFPDRQGAIDWLTGRSKTG